MAATKIKIPSRGIKSLAAKICWEIKEQNLDVECREDVALTVMVYVSNARPKEWQIA